MKVIGLTGGIASGKSTVSSFFKELGATVIDADQITHDLLRSNQAVIHKLVTIFGKKILDDSQKEIDRQKLGAIVFADEIKREQLEKILHPYIRLEIERQIQSAKKELAPLILVNAALLVETKFYRAYDGLITVKAEINQQIERLGQRNQLEPSEAMRRIRHQLPLEEKLKVSNWVIDNSGSIEETKKQVQNLFRRLTLNTQEVSHSGSA